MADNKIKVNELQTAAPELSDTLLASGAEREYACRISDLKDAIGGGGGGGGDWNANEGESGYIANRTHYVEKTYYEHTCTIPDDVSLESEWDTYNDESPTDDGLFDALYDTYIDGITSSFDDYGTIIINDTAYECKIYGNNNGDGSWYLQFSDEVQEYQYLVIYYSDDYKYITYNGSYRNGQNKTEVPLNIAHPLDLKYIPVSDLNIPKLNNIKDSDSEGGIIEGTLWGSNANVASGKHSHAEGFRTSATEENTHAEGSETTASDKNAHAEGNDSTASGFDSHAEGQHTTASGGDSHAEGYYTTASGMTSHAEGRQTTASSQASHAEGDSTTASGYESHAEGYKTTASGDASHADGYETIANHKSQHVFGEHNIADPSTAFASLRGTYIEIVGNGTIYTKSNARTLDWNGNEVLSGKLTVGAQPTNDNDVATKKYVDDHSGGGGLNNAKDAENGGIIEGLINGEEGQINIASGQNAHAEGGWTDYNPDDGYSYYPNTASGHASHAEGMWTTASQLGAHAEGEYTTASGYYSHAEGGGTTASGAESHAEGEGSIASGNNSHVEGRYTIANHSSQHVFGEYNIQDPSTAAIGNRGTYVEIVGNGERANSRSNARTLDWNGNEVLSGKLTVGTQPTNDNDVATKKYVDDHSGGGVYLVHAEYSENNSNDGYVVEVEDDVNDICVAIENGSMCFMKLNPLDEDEYRFVPLHQYCPAIEDGSPYLDFSSSFSYTDVPGGVILSRLRIIYDDGSWSFGIQRFELATLTSSDIS